MGFLVYQLRQLVMVIVIMICALFGTVGIIKLIKRFFPFIDLPQNLFHTGENNRNEEEGEVKNDTGQHKGYSPGKYCGKIHLNFEKPWKK